MSLSVCLIASAPAARVAALLEPVRGLADEIVIGADSRGDEATLAAYATLADRLFRIEYQLYERHLPWLHAQCSGGWILRLDDDEVISGAFLARLPELLADREVHQYWVARPWLYPDAGSVLDDPPWSVDFNNRLVRNDGTLRFRGVQHAHADPVAPCEYIEEPVYHLELLLVARSVPARGSSCRSTSSRHPSPGATSSRSTSSTRTCAGSGRAAGSRSTSRRDPRSRPSSRGCANRRRRHRGGCAGGGC